jgi:hypothetical protein
VAERHVDRNGMRIRERIALKQDVVKTQRPEDINRRTQRKSGGGYPWNMARTPLRAVSMGRPRRFSVCAPVFGMGAVSLGVLYTRKCAPPACNDNGAKDNSTIMAPGAHIPMPAIANPDAPEVSTYSKTGSFGKASRVLLNLYWTER